MARRLMYDHIHLSSLRQINALPQAVKHEIYRALIPDLSVLAARFPLPTDQEEWIIRIHCPNQTGFVEIDIRHPADSRDPLLYFQIADTSSGQIQVLLLMVNDPGSPRFDVDLYWQGECTKLSALPRNIPAEIAAMEAGLAPGQVRHGLHLCRELIPLMEQFIVQLGKDRFFIEPLTYHTAILFERYGFAYMTGQARMSQIHLDFQPGGCLIARLDNSTPFRRPGQERTVRGRSWAIHDGILNEAWGSVRMYKRVGSHAQICTFPGAIY